MTNHHILFPVALDLGAKTTGVYAAGYRSDTHIDAFCTGDVCKTAFVLEVDQTDKGYQFLQTDRTASRHSRRVRTRNKQAKKLFNLILECIYCFPVAKHEKAISHLMNRRGYSYLESSIDPEAINEIPPDLRQHFEEHLPEKIQVTFSEALYEATLWDALQLMAQNESHLHTLKQVTTDFISLHQKAKKALKPLLDAVDFLIKERTAGAKHRREYFSSIKKDLLNLRRHPQRECRRLFHALNDHKKVENNFLDIFYSTLCHINNFDLNTLNAIMRDLHPTHKASEIEKVISNRFGTWIMKQWRTSKSNGPQKISDIHHLREDWKAFSSENPEKVFTFWSEIPPERTIPPYESHTNRRPPSCQTLTFNPAYLDAMYSDWRSWLKQLETTSHTQQKTSYFREQLASVTSAKGQPLVSDDEIDARTLQFILDNTHDQDPFQLNATWAEWKKHRQLLRSGKPTNLNHSLENSSLPDTLRFQFDKPPQANSFWHLVFQYYQIRRRAKEGRYFLHYDNLQPKVQRWQRDGKLMVMCQHRPRQLKHQSHRDICVLLGLQPQQLSNALMHATCTETSALFAQVRGLKTACLEAQKAQKAYGIDLKSCLFSEKKLIHLCEKISSLLPKVAERLQLEPQQAERFCDRNDSIFIFAQLYPMVWGDRSGFSKTCPVCATDNASRMAGYDGRPTASRLHTLSMRMIDGGLKRLLNHKAHHLANRIFPMIEHCGKSVKKVTVPIIIEQNRFDFTDNLHKLKGVRKQKSNLKMDPTFDRNTRIKEASQGVCPYAPDQVLTDSHGDLDHIVPRSGHYGVLNDEANLIYASLKGNRDIKKNRELTLSDLNPTYLERQFGTRELQEIEQMIVERLQGDQKGMFRFGRYFQFAALTTQDQVAFRHALFLSPTHPLRQQVIQSIQHRNKTRVNGTQRYMAQLFADILTKKAQKSSFSGELAFDYIEVSAHKKDEDSTVALRRLIEDLTYGTEHDLSPFHKQKERSQQPYSHVIDATMAFMLALDKHQDEGCLRIQLNDEDSIWGNMNAHGELKDRLFSLIAVPQAKVAAPVNVTPQSGTDKARQLLKGIKPHQIYSREIFKKNPIGLSFYDLAVIDGQLYKGFVEQDEGSKRFIKASEKAVAKTIDVLIYGLEHALYRESRWGDIQVYYANKPALIETIFTVLDQAKKSDEFNKKSQDAAFVKLLLKSTAGTLYYYTTSADLENAPGIIATSKPSPFTAQWRKHFDLWNKQYPETKNDRGKWVIPPEQSNAWRQHCSSVLSRGVSKSEACYEPFHQADKRFTMRTIATSSGAMALVKRQSASSSTYQFLAINTKTLPKEHAAALAMCSKNLVLFDESILVKGYQSNVVEQPSIQGEALKAEQFLKADVCKKLGLETQDLEIMIRTPTTVEIKGLTESWFAKHLVLSSENTKKEWHQMSAMLIQNIANDNAVIHHEQLKSLLKRVCRNEKPAKVVLSDGLVSLTLSYRTPVLRKLLE